ncbi:unnamed protein product [Brachionus calyciflorus]|uniref:Reverse transcriptase Ty1/copia-type domain-containing protein n=1 Tax=Brachionus calyciflorus TaxID=104777 RepID=A0A814G556_9BILA|nr:unnamed protein product [Brachionus calyciflorus]
MGIDYQETFAPVVKLQSLRLLIAIAVQVGLKMHYVDISTAFLYGDIDEEIYIEEFKGNLKNNQVLKLNRALKNKCTIDFEQNLLNCGKNQVKLNTPVTKLEIICSTRQLTIEPLSVVSIKVKVGNVKAGNVILAEKLGRYCAIETIASASDEIEIFMKNNTPI